MEKDTFEVLTDSYSRLVRQKSTVDGHEIEHVFYVAGGFGAGDGNADDPADQGGLGGGGVSIPLGAYYSDGTHIRFHPNPIVKIAVGLPFFLAGAAVVRRMLTVLKPDA